MNYRKDCPLMSKFFLLALKLIAIAFAPLAVIGFVISKREISGDQYAAVLEIFGNGSRSGAIEIFGADIQTVSSLLDFLGTWSLPALVAIVCLGVAGLVFTNDRLTSTFHISLGLFISFGVWAILITRSQQAFTEEIGPAISGLAAFVISAYLSELSAGLLNLTGLLALFFGALAMGFWVAVNRRKASTRKSLN
jgi:hypothetical protein